MKVQNILSDDLKDDPLCEENFLQKNLCKDMKYADKKELIISAGNVFRDGSGTLQRRTICHRHLEVEGAAFKTRL